MNYSIVEEGTLPSKGKIYSVSVNPKIKIRSMTTEEEMRRLAPSEDAYKTLCEIIDACLVENPGISSYDMCMADYKYLLHKLRTVTYGPNYPTESVCPYCANKNIVETSLEELPIKEFNEEDYASLIEFTLPQTKKKIRLVMQSPRMLDYIEYSNREFKKQSKGLAGNSAFLFTVQELIDTVDGKKLDPVQKDLFVRSLPMMDTNYIVQKSEKLVESFGVDSQLNHKCQLCGLDYTTFFRYSKEFFRPSID